MTFSNVNIEFQLYHFKEAQRPNVGVRSKVLRYDQMFLFVIALISKYYCCYYNYNCHHEMSEQLQLLSQPIATDLIGQSL